MSFDASNLVQVLPQAATTVRLLGSCLESSSAHAKRTFSLRDRQPQRPVRDFFRVPDVIQSCSLGATNRPVMICVSDVRWSFTQAKWLTFDRKCVSDRSCSSHFSMRFLEFSQSGDFLCFPRSFFTERTSNRSLSLLLAKALILVPKAYDWIPRWPGLATSP